MFAERATTRTHKSCESIFEQVFIVKAQPDKPAADESKASEIVFSSVSDWAPGARK
jgi:hypothetical protein